MTVFNRVKEFLETRPDPVTGNSFTSPYRFWKDTKLSRATAYRLYNDPTYIPTGDVLNKVCSSYQIKPGVILDWEPDKPPQVATSNFDLLGDHSKSSEKNDNFSIDTPHTKLRCGVGFFSQRHLTS
jgi:hypothetical protein